MQEHALEPLIPRRIFLGRLVRHAFGGLAFLGGALGIGMAGYHVLEGLSWIDSFVNASMILGGMGPVAELHTTGGKLFAGLYALFAGIVFLVAVGVVFAPVIHRAIRRFHRMDAPASK